jgi:hypothetical protein
VAEGPAGQRDLFDRGSGLKKPLFVALLHRSRPKPFNQAET